MSTVSPALHKEVSLSFILGDAELFTDGDWVESKDQDPDGDVRLLQLADIGVGAFLDKSSRFLTKETAHRLNCSYLEPGDILLARMPDPIGRACIFPGAQSPCVTVVDVCVIRPNPRTCHAGWLVHTLNSELCTQQIARYTNGTTRQRISKTNLCHLRLPFPPLDEQRRIAAILDQADALRDKRRQALAQVEQLTQSVFLEMFGDPAVNPKGWPVASIGDSCNLFGGTTLPTGSAFQGQHDGWFLAKVSDMNRAGNETALRTCAEWSSVPGPAAASCPIGTVVIPKRGGAIGTNKKRVAERPTVLDPNLMGIKAGPDLVDEYLFAWFQAFDLSSLVSGSSVPQLNKKDLNPLTILLPPLDLQQDFARRVEAIERLKDAHRRSLEEMDALFASLQHRAFRGEL